MKLKLPKFLKKRGKPSGVIAPPLMSPELENKIQKDIERRVRKAFYSEHAKQVRDANDADLISAVLTENQKPLEYKLTRGTRDKLGQLIVAAFNEKS